jgi:hypothetical protein
MANGTVEYSPESHVKSIDEDERLVSAAKEDVEAFGKLYDKYYEDVFRYVYGRTFDHYKQMRWTP